MGDKLKEGYAMVQATDHSAEPTLNIPELLSRVDNDQELVRELLQLFKEECPRIMQLLEVAVSKQEMKAVETASHSLKGMLANLSATRAASAASRLEGLGRAGKPSQLKAEMTVLESEVAVLLPELDRCLEVNKPLLK
jgi:HPt (histidine-containing phosphotransfer) domain-containing protein